ncbi:MAG TPA: chorismate lyase [Noviherbaspirillum sp.]|uniref:chorismate--pyruvate lyase family protein n=1 Tax=Noviherbaspirillum sp. TaxID=1926288 RepID=UPI002B4A62F4|nr:chorismate lyase [Noviherbaspirillum sp.]HJV88110.1 chorismate lyase [Noviherbaspirillum sp.]
MKLHSIAYAHWCDHVNGVNPTPSMRGWLTDTMSLTKKLTLRSSHFRVRRLHQEHGLCLPDEAAIVKLPRRTCVQEREVLLQCDGRPIVYAHTIVPLSATASDWPFFGTLGERSLGTTLFGDPRVLRGHLQYARLRGRHPLARRACAALGGEELASPLFARRCLYRRRNGVLLVTELFLPAIAELGTPRRTQAQ